MSDNKMGETLYCIYCECERFIIMKTGKVICATCKNENRYTEMVELYEHDQHAMDIMERNEADDGSL